MDATLARLNRCSSMWQQFGFFHDVIVVDESWDRATYYEEMPLAYIHQSEIGQSNHYYTITLEFGKIEGDPHSPSCAPPSRASAAESVYLDP